MSAENISSMNGQIQQVLKDLAVRFSRSISIDTVGILFFDLQGNITGGNDAFLQMAGYSREDLEKGLLRWDELTPPEFMTASRQAVEELRNQGQNTPYEKQYIRKDGSRWWGLFAAKRLDDNDCIEFVQDITERKEVELALRESENRFRSSIESLNVGFSVYSSIREEGQIVDFRIEYVNEMTCRMGRRSRDQVVGHTLLELFPHFRADPLFAKYIQVVETGRPLVEKAYPYADVPGMQPRLSGKFDVHAVPFGDGLIVTLDDVTEQLQLELDHRQVMQERDIHHRLAEQREKERQSFAREIHDGPIQTLSGLMFSLSYIQDAYPDPRLQVEVSEITLTVKTAIQELRQVMNELRPPNLIRFGLSKTILVHVENLRERYSQITWHTELAKDEQVLEEQANLALFRIYQEAINNIIRHSEATQAWIQYQVEEDQVVLQVRDNGKGFAEQQDIGELTNNQHFGLAGITERAQALQAEFHIESQPGSGTVLWVRVPTARTQAL